MVLEGLLVKMQWFPGHMHKALKEMRENINNIDVMIEVLDARIPYSSENPEIAKIRGEKPCLKILNKYDLADPTITLEWQQTLEKQQGILALAVGKETANIRDKITQSLIELCPNKHASVKNINAMIVGIPNVGKSTLINTLAKRIIAKTGNEPAVTKSQQRINLGSGIVLFDTPGVLWPKLANPQSIYRLAACGAVKQTAMNYDDVGFFAAEYLITAYPDNLKQRYKLEHIADTELTFLEDAAKARGALMAGGRVNLQKICEVLVNELQAGVLGRISMETPRMIEIEKQHMAEAEIQKASDKGKRKKRFKRSR